MPRKRPVSATPDMPQETVDKCAKKDTATATEVLRELTDIGLGRRAFVAIDRQGNAVDHPASVPERIRALELLAKYHKLMGTTPEPPVHPVQIIDDIDERPAQLLQAPTQQNSGEEGADNG